MVRQLTPSRCGVLFVLLMFLALPTRLSAQVAIDATNFPDQYFRAWIQANYDDGNGYLDEAKAVQLLKLDVGTIDNCQEITDLKGIEFFQNLDSIYWAFSGVVPKLSSIDISKNINLRCLYLSPIAWNHQDAAGTNLPHLQSLDVSRNVNLETLCVHGAMLSELDISNNTALKYLRVDNNNLADIDVSNNLSLLELHVEGNKLTNINVSYNTLLEHLECGYNLLSELNISQNTNLEKLWCEANQFSNLDVSNNRALKNLFCGYNQLTDIDVTNNQELISLSVNQMPIKKLNISNNLNLGYLTAYNCELTSIDVTHLRYLYHIDVNKNFLTSLDLSMDLDDEEHFDGVPAKTRMNYNKPVTIVPYTKVVDGERIYFLYLNDAVKGNSKSLSDMIHEIEGEDVNEAVRFDISRTSGWTGDCTYDGGDILFLNGPEGSLKYKYDSRLKNQEYLFTFNLTWSEVQEEPSGRLRGDANGDGKVNSTDVVTVANYVLQMNPQPFVFENADVNEDGKVNITDLVGIANIILEIDE